MMTMATPTNTDRLQAFGQQQTASHSPWPMRVRIRFTVWRFVSAVLFRPTPKYFYRYRNWLLRRFGGRIAPTAYVAASCRVRIPWNLVMGDAACLGEQSEVYNLGPVVVGDRATVAQQA